jgi:hypothetical protein
VAVLALGHEARGSVRKYEETVPWRIQGHARAWMARRGRH